jgi:hypothetical protein
MQGLDVVERLDDCRATDPLGDPTALGHPVLDRLNATVTPTGVVVVRIDHDHVVAHPGEQVTRKIRHLQLGNRDHGDIPPPRGLLRLHGGCPGRRHDLIQRLRSPRVADHDIMAELHPAHRERTADVPRSNDPDFHVNVPLR